MALTPDQSRITNQPTGQRIRVVRPATAEAVTSGMQNNISALAGAGRSRMNVAQAESDSHIETAGAVQGIADEAFKFAADIQIEDAKKAAKEAVLLDENGRPVMPDLGNNPLSIYDKAYRETVEPRYRRAVETSLISKANALRAAGVNSTEFSKQMGDFITTTANLVPSGFRGDVLDGGKRLMTGHTMDLANKERLVDESQDFNDAFGLFSIRADQVGVLAAKGDFEAANTAYAEALKDLDNMDQMPGGQQYHRGIRKARSDLRRTHAWNTNLGMINHLTEGKSFPDQVRQLNEYADPNGFYSNVTRDMNPKALIQLVGAKRKMIHAQMEGQSMQVHEFLNSVLKMDGIMSRGSAIQTIEGFGWSAGAENTAIKGFDAIFASRKVTITAAEKSVAEILKHKDLGYYKPTFSPTDRQSLDLILQHEMQRRMSDPANAGRQDAIFSSYKPGSPTNMGVVMGMMKTYGHLSQMTRAALSTGTRNYDSPTLVENGLRIYTAVMDSVPGRAANVMSDDDRGFYSKLYAKVQGNQSFPEALKALRDEEVAQMKGMTALDNWWDVFSGKGTLGTGGGGRGGSRGGGGGGSSNVSTTMMELNEALAEGVGDFHAVGWSNMFPGNVGQSALAAFGLTASKEGLEARNLPAQFYGEGQQRLKNLLEGGFSGTAAEGMEVVVESLGADWTQSINVYTGNAPHDGYNLTKHALTQYVGKNPKNMRAVNDALRKQVANRAANLPFDLGEIELGQNVRLTPDKVNRENGIPTYRVMFLSSDDIWTPLTTHNDAHMTFNIDRVVAELPHAEPSAFNNREFWLKAEGAVDTVKAAVGDVSLNPMELAAKGAVAQNKAINLVIDKAIDTVQNFDSQEFLASLKDGAARAEVAIDEAGETVSVVAKTLPIIFRELKARLPSPSPSGRIRLDEAEAWLKENVPMGNMDDFMAFIARPEVEALAREALGDTGVELLKMLPGRIERDAAELSSRVQRDAATVRAEVEWLLEILPGRVSNDYDALAKMTQEAADEAIAALSVSYENAILQAQADGLITTEVAEDLGALPMDIQDLTVESMNTLRLAVPAPVRMMWDSFNPGILDRSFEGAEPKIEYTGADLRPGVVDTIAQASRSALQGRELEVGSQVLVNAGHYPMTDRNLSVDVLIGNQLSTHDRGLRTTFYDSTALGWSRMFSDMTTDAVVQTAYSVGEFMLHRDETGYYIEEVFQSGGFDYGTLMDTMKTVKEKTLFGSKKNANSPRIYVRLPGLELRRAPGRWRAGQPMPHTNDNRPPPGTPLPPSPPRRATGVPIMDDAGEE